MYCLDYNYKCFTKLNFLKGFCDTRDTIVKILRPLRSFDMKEIAMHNFLHSLEPVSVRQPRNNQYSSIQTLMVQFVNDLQENYPATVATVVKTGDKLALDEKKIAGRCKLCQVGLTWYAISCKLIRMLQGIILDQTEELSSDESTKFSKLVSTELPDHSVDSVERYTNLKDKFDALNGLCESSNYCFSCSRINEFLLDD